MEREKHVAKVKKSSQKGLALEPEKQEEFKQNLKKIKSKGEKEKGSGVVYLGHLPHGFYEGQLKKYMSQFGKVKAVKVSRSTKTGKSKGYAFVEFQSDDVARIVADTMNNYLVFERLIKCQYVPSGKLHPKTMGRRSGVFKPPKAHIISRDRHNNSKKEFKQEKSIRRLLKKHKKKSDMLKVLGIDLKMNSLEKVLESGKQILEEKEKEKLANETTETEATVKTLKKTNAKTPKSAKKSDSKSTPPSSDAAPKAPSSLSKAPPLSSKELKTPQATPVLSSKKAKTPKGTPALSKEKQQTPKSTPLATTPATSKATSVPSKKGKTLQGSPAVGEATLQTPKATPLATTPKSAATLKATPAHKVTPMPRKKNSKAKDPVISPKDQSMEILMEDSEEEDISFKTPPNTVRSSSTPRLAASAKKRRPQSSTENSNTLDRKMNGSQSKKKRKSQG